MKTAAPAPDGLSRLPVILVVDDSPENLRVMGDLLTPHYRVRIAASGRRALEISVQEPKPDLILLDVMMPEMDGYEVLQRLRENGDTATIPVIFLTAMDSADGEQKGLERGAVDYITKPIRPAVVLARVNTHLELKAARDQLRDRNILLEDEVAHRMEENQLIQDISIRALGHLAEIRDPETGNHIRRTQEYMRLLATKLQRHPRYAATLSNRTVKLLTESAPLHDIGKVGIPDHVLLKPGKLTEDEWRIMRTHTILGAEAIELAERDVKGSAEFLSLAKEIARWHHEKWDGSGYPDGLKGEAIPVSARLMAVADVFDALISSRVYKSSMSVDDAREIILEGRGQHFDADIVDVFLANFDDFVTIAERYRDGDMEPVAVRAA
jgi:putative two-component system response regulator